MDILGTADKYLTFNEKGEVMCGSCFGDRRNRARKVYLDSRDEPWPANASGFQPLHIEVDGAYVRFGRAKCGVHDRSYSRTASIKPDLLTGDRPLDFDLLRRAYLKAKTEEADREERMRRDYMADLIRTATMTRDRFTVEEAGQSGGMRWTVYGPTGYSDAAGKPQRRPVSQVSLENDAGVYRVTTSDFSGHVGRGRGSTALTRLVAELMVAAADKADEMNAALGLDAPADAEEV